MKTALPFVFKAASILAIFGFSLILPQGATAGFFSVVTEFVGEKDVNNTQFHNLQTLPILRSDTSPSGARGGGDVTIVESSALASEVGPSGTLTNISEQNHEISIYTVKKGDTLSQIAEMFGISVSTIIWANDLSGKNINEGESLVILPISGLVYTVRSGDTIKAIAKKYSADENEILAYNNIKDGNSIRAGQIITIPDAEASAPGNLARSSARGKSGTSASGYYIRPVKGVKTQGLHGYNGVDIGAPAGTPIIASARGVVIISRSSGWNGGYGNYVVIKHNNGTQTLYSHLSKVYVSVGETVGQGETIGTVGSTGKSTGPHLHFEIRGAKNPF